MFFSHTARCPQMTLQFPLRNRIPCVSRPSQTTRRFNAVAANAVPWKLGAGKSLEVNFDASTSGRIGCAEVAADTSSRAPPLLLPQESAAHSSAPASSPAGSRSSPEQRQQVLLDVKDFLSDELPSVWTTGVRPPFHVVWQSGGAYHWRSLSLANHWWPGCGYSIEQPPDRMQVISHNVTYSVPIDRHRCTLCLTTDTPTCPSVQEYNSMCTRCLLLRRTGAHQHIRQYARIISSPFLALYCMNCRPSTR